MKKLNYKKAIRYYLPIFLWAIVIFTFSTLPAHPVSKVTWQEFIFKKSAHMIEYGLFATLLYRALINSMVKIKMSGYFSVFVSFLYGISDEIHQSFTPGREPTLRDIMFDTIGAILAIYIIWKFIPILPPKLKKLAKDFQLT